MAYKINLAKNNKRIPKNLDCKKKAWANFTKFHPVYIYLYIYQRFEDVYMMTILLNGARARDGHCFCEQTNFFRINHVFCEQWSRSEKKRTVDEPL